MQRLFGEARRRPSRPFGMFGAAAFDIEGSLREIEHGLDVLKADGIVLFTSYRDKWWAIRRSSR
jgi:hypothetical protein